MVLRINGLFGWIDSNNKRSVALFAAFLLIFHLIALVTLAVPLALARPGYAPFLNWGGYARIFMPLLTIVGAAMFGAQYFWQTAIVRRRLHFNYVDASDEPRLCRLAEPLVITSGVPVPYLAVIESPAMNAFACGVRRADTVVVVTRGLLNELNDAEVSAVLAHEIAHIRDGDIRLMTAATVCLSSIQALFMNIRQLQTPWRVAVSLLMTLSLPFLLVVILTIGFLRQTGHWLAHAVRLSIASSREFIADAVAVQLTHNPAALVSALRKLEGRSGLEAAGTTQAMMIDGPVEGEEATHPRIVERIAALIRATGGMALEGLASLDMPGERAATSGKIVFGRRGLPAAPVALPCAAMAAFEAPPRRSVLALVRRIAKTSPQNIFGLRKEMNTLLVVWVFLFLGINHAVLTDPAALLAKLGPQQMIGIVRQANSPEDKCQLARLNPSGVLEECKRVVQEREARYSADLARDEDWIAEQGTRYHCFASVSLWATGAPESGYWPLNKSEENASVSQFTALASNVDVSFSQGQATDAALQQYVKNRRDGLLLLLAYYGPPGVESAQRELASAEHAAVLDKLRQRLDDPAYVARLGAIDRAEYRLLVDSPVDFVPCKVKLGHELRPPEHPVPLDRAFRET